MRAERGAGLQHGAVRVLARQLLHHVVQRALRRGSGRGVARVQPPHLLVDGLVLRLLVRLRLLAHDLQHAAQDGREQALRGARAARPGASGGRSERGGLVMGALGQEIGKGGEGRGCMQAAPDVTTAAIAVPAADRRRTPPTTDRVAAHLLEHLSRLVAHGVAQHGDGALARRQLQLHVLGHVHHEARHGRQVRVHGAGGLRDQRAQHVERVERRLLRALLQRRRRHLGG